jgi:hypothetical protein
MAWPGLVFGAAASWQPSESSIDEFKSSYDWAFYRNEGNTFSGVIENLDRAHTLLAGVKLDKASHELFWSDPFSQAGANTAAEALPITHDLRLSVEQAAETLLRDRMKAHLHVETLDDMLLAAWHLDTLGLKIQFTSEISRFYWDAYQNQTDGTRAQQDLDEIVDINGRLQSLRDAITQLREMYKEGWARENHPYWLDNVLVRYDSLASEVQAKIVVVQAAQRQYWDTKTLPLPEQLGFWWSAGRGRSALHRQELCSPSAQTGGSVLMRSRARSSKRALRDSTFWISLYRIRPQPASAPILKSCSPHWRILKRCITIRSLGDCSERAKPCAVTIASCTKSISTPSA